MTQYYLSKNYNVLNNAGNKAKTDIEEILSKLGYKNAGLPQTTYSNKIAGFLITYTLYLIWKYHFRKRGIL